ncbi:hypothetical protein [Oceanobacillus sp. CF4.6]|uniref:hypothetical protein n=1 Tax=Oceanobacillus sp. CF4.6 TaxID=3373080 RepID=UPI003EE48453
MRFFQLITNPGIKVISALVSAIGWRIFNGDSLMEALTVDYQFSIAPFDSGRQNCLFNI